MIGQERAADRGSERAAIPQLDLQYARRPDGTLHVALGGDWKLGRGIPALAGVLEAILQ